MFFVPDVATQVVIVFLGSFFSFRFETPCSVDHATLLCDFHISDASTSTSSPYLQAIHRFQSGASGYQLEAVRLDMGARNNFVQLRSLGHDVRWLSRRGRERTMHSVLFQVACWRLNSSIGARFYPPLLPPTHTQLTHTPPPPHTTTTTHHHLPTQPTNQHHHHLFAWLLGACSASAWVPSWCCCCTPLTTRFQRNLGDGSVANRVFLDRLVGGGFWDPVDLPPSGEGMIHPGFVGGV